MPDEFTEGKKKKKKRKCKIVFTPAAPVVCYAPHQWNLVAI